MSTNPNNTQLVQPSSVCNRQSLSSISCSQCCSKQILIEKYEKLVALLQKKLTKYSRLSTTLSNSTNVFNISSNKQKKVLTDSNLNQAACNIFSDINAKSQQKCSQVTRKIFTENIKEKIIIDKGLLKSAPTGFVSSPKIIRETRYYQIIKELKNQLQLKKYRIGSLSDQLFEIKNQKMHLRQIIHQFLKCIACDNNKEPNKKSQIIALLSQFFEYSEQQRDGIYKKIKQTKQRKSMIFQTGQITVAGQPKMIR